MTPTDRRIRCVPSAEAQPFERAADLPEKGLQNQEGAEDDQPHARISGKKAGPIFITNPVERTGT